MPILLFRAALEAARWCLQTIVAAAFVAASTVAAQSQQSVFPTSTVDELRQLSIGATEVAKGKFRRTLTEQKPDWLPLFNAIDVQTIDEVRPGGIAGMDGKKRVIHLNLGTTLVPHVYAEYATIRTHYGSRHNTRCKDYVRYLGDFYKEHGRSEPDQFAAALTRPLEFCGVSGLKTDKTFQSRFYKIFDDTFTPVFGLILAHEYAHHLLRHVPVKTRDPAKLRAIEDEADRRGSVLFGRIASRTRAAVVFSVMASYRAADPFDPRRRAVSEECRFLYYLVDDARFANIYSLQELLDPIKDRIDIMERIPTLKRELEMYQKGITIPNCEILY